jgi:hypothetical protein
MDEIDRAYKGIVEFVVAFQWAENKYREVGWFILDPRAQELAAASTYDLLPVSVYFDSARISL